MNAFDLLNNEGHRCVGVFLSVFYLIQARTIKVTNISMSATADNIKEFFSFSGEVEYVEMRRSVRSLHSAKLFISRHVLLISVQATNVKGIRDITSCLRDLQGVPWSRHCAAPLCEIHTGFFHLFFMTFYFITWNLVKCFQICNLKMLWWSFFNYHYYSSGSKHIWSFSEHYTSGRLCAASRSLLLQTGETLKELMFFYCN